MAEARVPGSPIRMRTKCDGKRAVHSPPVRQRRRLIDGGPHQWVPESHVRQIDPDQAGGNSGLESLGGDGHVKEVARGEQRLGQGVIVIGRCQQQ